MYCEHVRTLLQNKGVAGLKELASDELQSHLEECADCREVVSDMQFKKLFGELPVAGPGEGFAERVLSHAWKVRDGRKTPPTTNTGWYLATAATLVLAVGAVFMNPGTSTNTGNGSPLQMVEVAPREVRQVDLLMVSERALADASITLNLDENVILAGYPDNNSIRWSTPIAAGNNQLTLPVQLRGDRSGSIVVEVESNGARKQMLLTVEAVPSGSQITMAI